MQSAAFRSDAYAIAFDRNAAEQRASLGVAERVELEDLVADLSTEGSQREAKADAAPGSKAVTVRGTTESKNVEIEYVIDQASRRIQVVAVRWRRSFPGISQWSQRCLIRTRFSTRKAEEQAGRTCLRR